MASEIAHLEGIPLRLTVVQDALDRCRSGTSAHTIRRHQHVCWHMLLNKLSSSLSRELSTVRLN